MKATAHRATILVLLAGVALVLAACSGQEPPAATPEPEEPSVPAPAPATTEPSEPDAAGDWETAATPSDVLTPEEINRQGILRTIYFDYDKSEIRPDQRPVLQENARWLRDNAGVTILIEGHCDERGTREYNQALGERRARATMDYLVSLGIPTDRIEIISYGEERPAAQGNDESAWSRNRRSDFRATAVTGN